MFGTPLKSIPGGNSRFFKTPTTRNKIDYDIFTATGLFDSGDQFPPKHFFKTHQTYLVRQ